MAVKSPDAIPGTGPDYRYHTKIRTWWTTQDKPWFPGQAPPDVEAAYLAAHPGQQPR